MHTVKLKRRHEHGTQYLVPGMIFDADRWTLGVPNPTHGKKKEGSTLRDTT